MVGVNVTESPMDVTAGYLVEAEICNTIPDCVTMESNVDMTLVPGHRRSNVDTDTGHIRHLTQYNTIPSHSSLVPKISFISSFY